MKSGMTLTWWLYVGAFIASVIITIMGIIQGNTAFVVIGVIIGVALYFTRKQVQ